jgi:hypothetical protein
MAVMTIWTIIVRSKRLDISSMVRKADGRGSLTRRRFSGFKNAVGFKDGVI